MDTLDFAPELRDAAALERFQLAQLRTCLERARETPFYAPRLAAMPARVDTPDALRAIPVTTKADVLADLADHPPFGSRLRASTQQVRHLVTTSGTSGAGEEVYPLDAEDERAVFKMAARGFHWAGVAAGSTVLNTLPLTTSAAGQWYYHGLRLLGANVLSVGSFPTERKLEYLRRFGADTIVGTPSYVLRMAVDARRLGLDPARLGVRAVVVAGESWAADWMGRLEQAWGGAKAFEQYGSTQRAMAWSCPAGALTADGRGVLHALSDHGLYEIIDPDTGEPVCQGPGELVVTPFGSSASPLIRFATGDRVTAVAPCPCGRPGPWLAAGLVDRYDFMVKVRGVNLWPEALDRAVFSVAAARDFEARVATGPGGREELEIDVEAEGDGGSTATGVAEAVRRLTGLHATVNVVAAGAVTGAIEDRFRKRSRLRDCREAQGA